MPAPRIGILTRSLARPLRACLDLSARAGASGIEIDLRNEATLANLSPSGIRELRKLLADRRLGIAACGFPTRRGFADAEDLDRRIAATQSAMNATKSLGGQLLVINPGELPDSTSPHWGQLIESLTNLARHGEHVGVRIALAGAPEKLEQMPALLEQLPDYQVGVCLDPADLVAASVPPVEAVATIGSRLVHVYASDAVRDLATRKCLAVELGRGSVEWPELLGALEEHDYQGWLSIKLREAAMPGELENAIAYLRVV